MEDMGFERLRTLKGRAVYGRGGSALGTVIEVLFHRDSGRAWIAVDTGRSSRPLVVPLVDATVTGFAVYLPLPTDEIAELTQAASHDGLVERLYGGKEE